MRRITERRLLNSLAVLGGSAALYGVSHLIPESRDYLEKLHNVGQGSGLLGILTSSVLTAGFGIRALAETGIDAYRRHRDPRYVVPAI